MSRPLTALVLTPNFGGDFFGTLITGLAREIVRAEGRLVVVETPQADPLREQAGEPSDFDIPVGWDEVDGIVSVMTAAGAPYLERARAAGKPVVLLSSSGMGDFQAPVVRPDNIRGMAAQVEHLIEHGHTRIGFVGNLALPDMRDRYEGYVRALEAHGLTVDPDTVFAAPENGVPGGTVAAHAILAASSRPTALAVSTDRNALGLMEVLESAGVNVPEDIAIGAFDNMAVSTFSSPALSTVEPRFDEVGALAGRLLLAKIRGEDVPSSTFTPLSAVLIARESCGCNPDARRGSEPAAKQATGSHALLLRSTLRGSLERELLSGDKTADTPVRETIDALVEEAVRLINLGDEALSARIKEFTAALLRLNLRPDTLRRFMDAMRQYAQHAGTWVGPDAAGGTPVSPRIAASLWKAQAGALLHQTEATHAAAVEQYAVDAGLLETGDSDPRDLAWLSGTRVRAAALGLWKGDPADRLLTVVGEYGKDGAPLGLIGTELRSQSFPPERLISRASAAARETCVVVPVGTGGQEWGLLSVIVEIDPAAVRDTHPHWAALLCAALESQRREEEVRRSALFDPLTQLPNRQLFMEQVERALVHRERSGTPFAILFLDLDGFKLVNDSLGHQMGDRVLKEVAHDISRTLRGVDTAARFGGDEFVVLLADTEPSTAMVAAQRVQQAIDQVRILDGHEIATRASIGIASSAVGYTSADDVLRDADHAMYQAKMAEPGTIEYFDAPMHDSAVRRAVLAKDVLKGLQEDQFEVHYQPIVNLVTGCTDRFEALVRWRHPERGLLGPTDFLEEIEETSLIVQLGHRVLDDVCRQLAQWGPRVANVSINISDKEFWSQNLLTRVTDSLEEHGLSPDLLTLEITESVLMRRPEMALRIMRKLHEAGIKLHIDDFGTGYSSLETLHRFPVEAFKIDRSFIHTLATADNSSELISSLVKLGKALGIAVVAEGVETQEQLTYLQELGCATGQGFLFMPAVTGDRAGELLGRSLHDDGED